MNSLLRQRCRAYATARFGWDQVIERLEQELLTLAGGLEASASRIK